MKKFSPGGSATFGGINSQAWAALSLLLQYVSSEDFLYIGFEGEHLSDFHLVFKNNWKIICESKSMILGHSDIVNIALKIKGSGNIGPSDQILIICQGLKPRVKQDLELFKYYDHIYRKKIIDTHFTKELETLLPQLKTWEVSQQNNQALAIAFLANLIGVWLPEERLKEKVNSILVEKIYKGSQDKRILTRNELLELFESVKQEVTNDSGYYDQKQEYESQVEEVINGLSSPNSKENSPNQIAALTANFTMHRFFLSQLKQRSNLRLRDWDTLLVASAIGPQRFLVADIIKKNIESNENRTYFFVFANKILEKDRGLFNEEFIRVELADIAQSIIQRDQSYCSNAFEIIPKLFQPSINEYVYTKRQGDASKWSIERFAELLLTIYDLSGTDLREEIICYIYKEFQVSQDSGQFWHHTPPPIYEILKKYVSDNPEERILQLVKIIGDQIDSYFSKYARRKTGLKFKGWDFTASGISQFGGDMSISDKWIVSKVIRAAINAHYHNDNKTGWKFVINECLTTTPNRISRERPDFLNRAVIDVLMSEYGKVEHTTQAFSILKKLVLMRRGIPEKSELIFQALKHSDLPDVKKWELVKAQLDDPAYDNAPANAFVEQIATDLALKGNKEAAQAVVKWTGDVEKINSRRFHPANTADTVIKLLNHNETVDEGFEALSSYIQASTEIRKVDAFNSYDTAKALALGIKKNYSKGLSLLLNINSSPTLSENAQVLICSSLNQIDVPALAKKLFEDFVEPMFKELKLAGVATRFSYRNRESLVQLADKLAEAKHFKEAFWLVNFFISDDDPPKDHSDYPDDPDGVFNYHRKAIEGDDNNTITTVRGWCAWTLQRFTVAGAKNYVEKIIPLVKNLLEDPNYYVRQQACVPLAGLMQSRHTVVSLNTKERFMPVEAAKKVEDLALAAIRDQENQKVYSIMKGLSHVINYFRSATTEQAQEVLNTFLSLKISKPSAREIYDDIAPLLIFFAEFRKDAYKNSDKSHYGVQLWNKINDFDNKPFREKLSDLLVNGSDDMRSQLAWQFMKLTEENTKETERMFSIAYRYLLKAVRAYNHRVYESTYLFIEKNLERYPVKSLNLWKRCVEKEYEFLSSKSPQELTMDYSWYPYFYNGKVLAKLYKEEGEEEFLAWFKKLINYPEGVLIANDIEVASIELEKISNTSPEANEIFTALAKKDPTTYHNRRMKWLKKN